MLFMLGMLKKTILLPLVLLLLDGCMGESPLYAANLLRPGGKIFTQMPKNAPPAYKKGWIEGCESGMSIFGHIIHKDFYAFKKDYRFFGKEFGDERDLFDGHKITDNEKKEYQVAWASTYSFCRHYIVSTQKGGIGMMPHVPGQAGAGKLHGTYNIYDIQAWGPNADQGLIENW